MPQLTNLRGVYRHDPTIYWIIAQEEALTMFTSNEYEEESGPILYNAAIILDNRPDFVHSKFLFSKLSLLFIFPPKHLSIMDCRGFRQNCTEFK